MKVLHLIDSLNFGGAETLLMSYIPLLPEFQHTVIAISGSNVHSREHYEYIELNKSLPYDFFTVVLQVKKIIKKRKIDIVHSHSYWTNILSRFCFPKNIKIFNHYHFADYDSMNNQVAVKRMILIDRVTNRKSITMIAVSGYVAGILKKIFPDKKIVVLSNFVIGQFTFSNVNKKNSNFLKIVAVGNCNIEKNYDFLLSAFEQLISMPIQIDIIGGGDKLDDFTKKIKEKNITNVHFIGFVDNVREKIADYDLYLSTSISETFGISVLEAISVGLPLLLSDIPAFKEIAPKGTIFFNPLSTADFVSKIKQFYSLPWQVTPEDYKAVLKKFSPENYLLKLKRLYND